jgi:hypothetical protein
MGSSASEDKYNRKTANNRGDSHVVCTWSRRFILFFSEFIFGYRRRGGRAVGESCMTGVLNAVLLGCCVWVFSILIRRRRYDDCHAHRGTHPRGLITGWDPSFNPITGLNASGKSNILDAICFVLGLTNMSSVHLLHNPVPPRSHSLFFRCVHRISKISSINLDKLASPRPPL